MNNIKRIVQTLIVVLPVVLVTGCVSKYRPAAGTVAEVGDAVLTAREVSAAIPSGLTEEDSLRIATNYVEAWARKQVKLLEAEKVLAEKGIDVESMVEDYRNSLLSRRLDMYYVENCVDTLVSDTLTEMYYRQHKPEFRMDRDIFKGRVVVLPADFRWRTRLKNLMGDPKPDSQEDFIGLAAKNGIKITDFNSWTEANKLFMCLPTSHGNDYGYLLRSKNVEEVVDENYRYYVQITDCVFKGEQAPLEWVDGVVRNIIYNKRNEAMLKHMEDSLYSAACRDGAVKIYLQANQEK